jgi:hypothetical protein
MALVTAQEFYRVYDDTGVPLPEADQDGTHTTTVMVFTNSGAQADRTLSIHHGMNGYLVKYGVGTPDQKLEARWVELYGYTTGTIHPGYEFGSADTAMNLSPNHLQVRLIGVPTQTTYRGVLVLQKLHTIMQ